MLMIHELFLAASTPPTPMEDAQQAADAPTQPEEPQQPPVKQEEPQQQPPALDFSDVNQLLSAFDAMKHVGTIIPKCYSVSDRTVQKFFNRN